MVEVRLRILRRQFAAYQNFLHPREAFGAQATQWAQRVLYLQGQLDLLNELDPNAPAPKPGDKVVLPTRAERRRQEKVARANGGT